MPENPGVDLIKGPPLLAAETIAFQMEHIIQQLQGPDQPQRREMVGDIPLDDLMPEILAQMEAPQP